jgi:hypothetical protein
VKLEPLIEVPPGTPASARVKLDLYVLRETEKALLVTRDRYDGPKAWVPKSGVFRHDPNKFGGLERISLNVWLFIRVRDQL